MAVYQRGLNSLGEIQCNSPIGDIPEGTVFEIMKSEQNRLDSYADWPYESRAQRPTDLAEAGLFYTHTGDRVQCPFCYGVLKNWLSSDVPFHEHARHFPFCAFIRGLYVGNIPIRTDTSPFSSLKGENSSTAVNIVPTRYQETVTSSEPHYNTDNTGVDLEIEENRLNTFSRWPPNKVQRPEDLARAGLYHYPCPDKLDRVRCAYCGGKLFNWDPEDDPYLEHARCFPNCRYMKIYIGDISNDLHSKNLSLNRVQESLTSIRQHHRKELPTQKLQSKAPSFTTAHIGTLNSSNVSEEDESKSCEKDKRTKHNEINSCMTNESVQAVLEMGFSKELVETVLGRCIQERPENLPDARELASLVMTIEDQATELATSAVSVSPPTPLQRFIASHSNTRSENETQHPHTSSEFSAGIHPAASVHVTSRAPSSSSPLQRFTASQSDSKYGTETEQSPRPKFNASILSAASGYTNAIKGENKEKQSNSIPEQNQPRQVVKDIPERLREENTRLRDQFLCKICMEDRVRITFMSCGHIACCGGCSMAVSECPICRTVITGRINTIY